MDYVQPAELIQDMLAAASRKAGLSIRDMFIRGFLAGAILSFATSLAMVVVTQGLPPIVGAILFPAGFVILVLLGLELATGNFALLPAAVADGQVSLIKMLRNWAWVYVGNLAGSLFYAILFCLAISSVGSAPGGPLVEVVKLAAQKKTLGYAALGAAGWETAFVKAVLCNWMVTLGAVLALSSRSTIGKITAMWLPILVFFAQGYEHSIVNMFVIPAGRLMGAPISVAQWWFWNQIPVTLGNILSGSILTGLALYFTFKPRPVVTAPATAESAAPSVQSALENVSAAG